MKGILQMKKSDLFSSEDAFKFASSIVSRGGKITILASDGIILDVENYLPRHDTDKIHAVRILTPYQLENVLMTNDSDAFYIVLRGSIIRNWSRECFESIMEIIRIKTYFKGAVIAVNIVGDLGIHSLYMQKAALDHPKLDRNKGLYLWEEPLPL